MRSQFSIVLPCFPLFVVYDLLANTTTYRILSPSPRTTSAAGHVRHTRRAQKTASSGCHGDQLFIVTFWLISSLLRSCSILDFIHLQMHGCSMMLWSSGIVSNLTHVECLTCFASPRIEANRAEGGGLLDAISYTILCPI